MEAKIPEHFLKFISSQRMENSEIQKNVINLGKLIVDELGLDQDYDTLAKWMAHYIAGLIKQAEHATGNEKTKIEHECFDTILKLWDHRSSFPDGRRPFESFESIFRALDKIDSKNQQPYYLNITRPKSKKINHDEKHEPDEIEKWLIIALSIDEVARIWFTYIFEQASIAACDEKTIKWLEETLPFAGDNDITIVINSLVKGEEDEDKKIHKELLEEKIKKIEAYRDFNELILGSFKKKLKNLM